MLFHVYPPWSHPIEMASLRKQRDDLWLSNFMTVLPSDSGLTQRDGVMTLAH